jgi:hypothetical protein
MKERSCFIECCFKLPFGIPVHYDYFDESSFLATCFCYVRLGLNPDICTLFEQRGCCTTDASRLTLALSVCVAVRR